MNLNPWIPIAVVLAVLVLLLVGLLWSQRRRDTPSRAPLPGEWGLAPRPVFSSDERRLYRLLREALPNHVILAKLPLVRFCQPVDPKRVHYWFDLLGASHVAFAVCSANGRVLAAIDFDHGRGDASRSTKLKQGVMNALRVRYLRCQPELLPSIPELQMLVPQQTGARVGSPAAALNQARDTLSSTVATRRAQRQSMWQDSTQFSDSFFAPDTRMDGFAGSGHGDLLGRGPNSRYDSSGFDSSRYDNAGPDEDVGGVVIDGVPVRFASSR